MTGSQDLCPISFEILIGLQITNRELLWRIGRMPKVQRNAWCKRWPGWSRCMGWIKTKKVGTSMQIDWLIRLILRRTESVGICHFIWSMVWIQHQPWSNLTLGSTNPRDRDPRCWRCNIQHQFQRVWAVVNDRLESAIQDRAHRQNEDLDSLDVGFGLQVWLYLGRVKKRYARKLAHMWHGPYRVAEKCGDHTVCLEIANTPYRLFPVFYVSKLKLVRVFPERPTTQTNF